MVLISSDMWRVPKVKANFFPNHLLFQQCWLIQRNGKIRDEKELGGDGGKKPRLQKLRKLFKKRKKKTHNKNTTKKTNPKPPDGITRKSKPRDTGDYEP